MTSNPLPLALAIGPWRPWPARQSGHIDNRPLFVIVPVLALVAVTYYQHVRTGSSVAELFWSLPAPWPGFLLTLPAVLALCLAVLLVGSRLGDAGSASTVDQAGVTHLPERQRNRFNLLAGLCAALLGVTLLLFGVLGPGWFWVLVALVGALLLVIAAMLASMRTTWTFAPGNITRTEHVFGQPQIRSWEVQDAPAFTLEKLTTGGAFGQPLEMRYQVRLGEAMLLECTDQERADALIAALEAAYPPPSPARD